MCELNECTRVERMVSVVEDLHCAVPSRSPSILQQHSLIDVFAATNIQTLIQGSTGRLGQIAVAVVTPVLIRLPPVIIHRFPPCFVLVRLASKLLPLIHLIMHLITLFRHEHFTHVLPRLKDFRCRRSRSSLAR